MWRSWASPSMELKTIGNSFKWMTDEQKKSRTERP